MRTVVYFADMLRANLIEFESSKNSISSLINSLGGTYFTNCVTSAPDTPRSMAIFFSGLSPKSSGINRRSMWPGPHLPVDTPTIFDQVIESGLPLYVVDRSIGHSGLFFPAKVQKAAHFFPDLASLYSHLDRASSRDNEVIFIVDKSYHVAVDGRFAHKSASLVGERKIAEGIKKAVAMLQLVDGDQLFVLSDHGCKLSNDDYSELGLMNRDRSQIFFFHSGLRRDSLDKCESLFAMEDVHKIVKASLGCSSRGEKHQVLEIPPARKMVHVEDHVAFSTLVGDPTRKWAVFAENFEYFESLSGNQKIVGVGQEIDFILATEVARKYLIAEASDYQELRYQLHSLQEGFSYMPAPTLQAWESKNVNLSNKRIARWALFWRFVTLLSSIRRRMRHYLSSRIFPPQKNVSGSLRKVLY